MSHIFISYSRKDFDFASKIVQALAEIELDTWTDWKSIPKGEDWEQEIYRGVEEADACLFLISPDSVASQMCNQEIAHAIKNGKRILPIVIRDADLKTIHPEISKRNWIFCRDGQDDFNKAIEEARRTIHTDYEWLRYHAELQVKALKWEQKQDASRLLRGKELREAEQQLAEISSQEDPQPTQLQREYVLSSQRNENRRRRRVTINLAIGLVTIFSIALIAVWQWQRADQQFNVALARQLSAQAKLLETNNNKNLVTSMLLATESHKRKPNLQADQVLRNGFAFMPVIEMSLSADTISNVDWGINQQWVLYNTGNGRVKVWDVINKKKVSDGPKSDEILCSYFLSDQQVISTTKNGAVLIWDFTNDHIISEWKLNAPSCPILSPDHKFAFLATKGAIQIREIKTGVIQFEKTYQDDIVDAAFNSNHQQIVIATTNGNIYVLEVKTGKEMLHFLHAGGFGLCQKCVAFNPNGQFVASGGKDGTIRVWSIAEGKEIATETYSDAVKDVSFDPSGKWLVSVSDYRIARVWNFSSNEYVLEVSHDLDISGAKFSPDGSRLITAGCEVFAMGLGCVDSSIRVWALATGREIVRKIGIGDISDFALSPDGKSLVSAINTSSGNFQVWDITNVITGENTLSNENDAEKIAGDFAVSPDGSGILKTVCEEYGHGGCIRSTVRVLDAKTNEEIARKTYAAIVNSALFSSNSKWVVSVINWGNTTDIWLWKPDDMIAESCKRLPRNLTRAEWSQYIGDALPYQAVCPNLPIEPEITITPTP